MKTEKEKKIANERRIFESGLSQGYEAGKSEAIKQELVFLEWLKDFLYREEIECFPLPLLDRIDKLKSKLGELTTK